MSTKTPKKKNPIIVSNLQDDYIIEKSRPLMLMKEVPFELGELKVLDTYLSRIDARDPKATTVRFSKNEYEDLMGIERMHPERLGKYVDSLMQKIITVPDKRARGGWRKYTLFCASECGQDENEQWWIDLTCTQEAKKLFFNLEKIGYIRYQLKNVLPLTSKYSVLLYIYLLDNRFRCEWDISVDELREKIFRNNSTYYANTYKDFKRDILDKAIKEVNAKTDLTFEYSPVKSGRKVTAIHWKLIKDEVLLPLEQDPNQTTIDEFLPPADSEDPNDFYASALPPEFTPDQVETLRMLAAEHYSTHLYHPSDLPSDRELKIYEYLKSKMLVMQAQSKPVQKKFAWLKKAVAGDWKV